MLMNRNQISAMRYDMSRLLVSSHASRQFHAEGKPPSEDENPIVLFFQYTKHDGEKIRVLAREGESLLDVAHNNGIDLEGACESSLACSTCHVILS